MLVHSNERTYKTWAWLGCISVCEFIYFVSVSYCWLVVSKIEIKLQKPCILQPSNRILKLQRIGFIRRFKVYFMVPS